jgi:23S rRNA pseudouridine1911/1915/1917 synthase
MKINILYEDENLLAVDKPAGITVFPEGENKEKTLIDYLLDKYPKLNEVGNAPRHGIIHRLDKDTSGILLVAKNNKTLAFLQNQFKERLVTKKYVALVNGELKEEVGIIETLIGRSPKDRRKQKIYLPLEPGSKGKKQAITEYKVLEKYKEYTLIEAAPKTGRKHQVRSHLAYLHHPIAGDKLYGFKNQPSPKNLTRQFLHAYYIKIRLINNEVTEFKSDLPEDLKNVIKNL